VPFERDAFFAPEVDAFETELRAPHAAIDAVFRDACRVAGIRRGKFNRRS
jgi:hypothetical protein